MTLDAQQKLIRSIQRDLRREGMRLGQQEGKEDIAAEVLGQSTDLDQVLISLERLDRLRKSLRGVLDLA